MVNKWKFKKDIGSELSEIFSQNLGDQKLLFILRSGLQIMTSIKGEKIRLNPPNQRHPCSYTFAEGEAANQDL